MYAVSPSFRWPTSGPRIAARSAPMPSGKSVNSKGLGLFVLSNIPEGSVILEERPILLFAYPLELSQSAQTCAPLLLAGLAQACRKHLSEGVLKQLATLASARRSEQSPNSDWLVGVIETNGVRAEVGDAGAEEIDSVGAVLLTTSRCNHRFVTQRLVHQYIAYILSSAARRMPSLPSTRMQAPFLS
jgi:hypothetical protein